MIKLIQYNELRSEILKEINCDCRCHYSKSFHPQLDYRWKIKDNVFQRVLDQRLYEELFKVFPPPKRKDVIEFTHDLDLHSNIGYVRTNDYMALIYLNYVEFYHLEKEVK